MQSDFSYFQSLSHLFIPFEFLAGLSVLSFLEHMFLYLMSYDRGSQQHVNKMPDTHEHPPPPPCAEEQYLYLLCI